MPDHYYSKQPQSKMITETRTFTLNNHSLTFTTATGVFSKKGIDFGSKVLIETFDLPHTEGDLLDLGCGYGPIGLALAKDFKNRNMIMVDINERAVELAQQNAKQNQIFNVEIMTSDGFENVSNNDFAAILTNPPIRAGKTIIYDMLRSSELHLKSNGELWIVVQKKQGAPSMISYLETFFHKVEVMARKKGYFIIRAKKS